MDGEIIAFLEKHKGKSIEEIAKDIPGQVLNALLNIFDPLAKRFDHQECKIEAKKELLESYIMKNKKLLKINTRNIS